MHGREYNMANKLRASLSALEKGSSKLERLLLMVNENNAACTLVGSGLIQSVVSIDHYLTGPSF